MMRHRLVLAIAGVVCLSPALGGSLLAQTPAAPAPAPAAQAPPPPRGQSTNIPRREAPNDKPAPRSAAGKMLLGGATAGQKGVWTPLFSIVDPILEANKVPFKPWAKALYDYRQANELEPHARCKASGVARQFLTPYGVEFVELPEAQRLYIFDVGGPHTFRTVYMDGRTHPTDLPASYYGHSIGWWEGDTLVIETTGFNERFWLDRRGLPHTEKLRTLERFTRTSAEGLKYEATIDDPGAYTAPWTGWFHLRFNQDVELFEYVCQQANYAHELMVGEFDSVDRATTIVP